MFEFCLAPEYTLDPTPGEVYKRHGKDSNRPARFQFGLMKVQIFTTGPGLLARFVFDTAKTLVGRRGFNADL